MEYIRFDESLQKVSRIAFGCWAIGGHGYGFVDDQTSYRAVHAALEEGINLFDTADTYGFGHSEKILSKALGHKRFKVLIATKGGVRWDSRGRTRMDCSPKYIKYAVENSLTRLKLDCISLYQIHWYDGLTPIDDIVETLELLKSEGKIKHYGLCNFDDHLIDQAKRSSNPLSIQLSFGLNKPKRKEFLSIVKSRYKLLTIVYNVLGRGIFTGKYDTNTTFTEKDTRSNDNDFNKKIELNMKILHELERLGSKYSKSSTQIAIRFVLDHAGVDIALIGIKTPAQARENAKASDWCLCEEDHAMLSSLSHNIFFEI